MTTEYRASDSKILSQRLGMIMPVIMGCMSCIFSMLLITIVFLIPPTFSQISMISIVGIFIAILFFFIGILQFLILLINYWIYKTVRIITTSEGIAFFSPGLELKTNWKNIAKIDKKTNIWGISQGDFLILKEPGLQKTTWWFRLFRRDLEKEIPLSIFEKWRETGLGRDIKEYVNQVN